MSWLLFLDESGNDHHTVPYEIHGGIAIHASKLWPFITAVRRLEQTMFGVYLHEYDSEIKGSKLLGNKAFRWAAQASPMGDAERRKHALNFLNNGKQHRRPSRDEFTAFGQACIAMAKGIIDLLDSHDAKVFAAIIPPLRPPADLPNYLLRKDLVYLLERYFYFLEEQEEMGLLVMDGTEKAADRKLIRLMEGYFTSTIPGTERTRRIVPVPIFVESDMAYGVQVADLCIYCLNWGFRLSEMSAPTRDELRPFAALLSRLVWTGNVSRMGQHFRSYGIMYLPDPYQNR